MRKLSILLMVFLVSMIVMPVYGKPRKDYNTITEGEIYYSDGHYLEGEPIPLGFDPFGYNYQAHIFKGYYCNYILGYLGYPPYEGDDEAYYQRLVDEGYVDTIEEAEQLMSQFWFWEYRDIWLQMKWNDAWLSNMDRDGDGKLDRHWGYDSYIGSGAWLTNHMRGEEEYTWTYFVKIVAVPEDAYLEDGIWYTSDGKEIGPVIWGQFAIIQEVVSGEGAIYVSPAGPGLGKW